MDDWGILTSLTWTLGRPNIPKSWFGTCRLWRLAFHPVVDTPLSGWLCVCLGHTMEERLLTLKIIGSKTRDDNSKLYKMHFQRPYLLVKKQENTPPASCPSSKRRWWRNCAPSCQQADFSPPGLSAAPPGVQRGWESDQQLAARGEGGRSWPSGLSRGHRQHLKIWSNHALGKLCDCSTQGNPAWYLHWDSLQWKCNCLPDF